MAEQTLTLQASSLNTKYYSATTTQNSTTARQGRYKSHASQLVGIIRFEGLAAVSWKSKSIKSVVLKLTHGEVGKYNGDAKTFQLWPSNYQKANDDTVNGSTFIHGLTAFGEFSAACRKGTVVTLTLPTDNANMLTAIEAYLKSGAVDTFCLYRDEEITSGYNYTPNYLAVTAAEISITYDDAVSVVNYGVDGEWKPCMVYHGINGEWVPCAPSFGKDGEWISV